jgi:hypothetical protein
MADLGFIPLVFWHPNTVLVIQRCGAHKEVIFVHYCIRQLAHCAIVMVENFDAVLRDSRGLC